MASPTLVPIEVYLRSSDYEPDAEYVDGVIEERPMGEYDHGDWQQAILSWFLQHAKEWNIRVIPELRVQVSRTRFRVPDVTVLDRAQPVEQIITSAPLAVFEVLSPEDTVRKMQRKLNDYAAMGIPQIWVIDPENGDTWRYVESALAKATEFSCAQKGINFDVRDISTLLQK